LTTNEDNDQNREGRGRDHGFGHWRDERKFHEKMEKLRRVQFGQRGFLRPQILQLLEKQPMNGVDIMNQLQDMSHGWYRPSPGSIYPLLEQLEKEGLIAKNADGKFELTSAYGEQTGVGDDLAGALSSIESNTSFLEDIARTDSARMTKVRERIEKIAKRMQELDGAVHSERGTA
jgi:hypothetical protein